MSGRHEKPTQSALKTLFSLAAAATLLSCGPISPNAERNTVYVDHYLEACSNPPSR